MNIFGERKKAGVGDATGATTVTPHTEGCWTLAERAREKKNSSSSRSAAAESSAPPSQGLEHPAAGALQAPEHPQQRRKPPPLFLKLILNKFR